jgi:hypothetical protein
MLLSLFRVAVSCGEALARSCVAGALEKVWAGSSRQ